MVIGPDKIYCLQRFSHLHKESLWNHFIWYFINMFVTLYIHKYASFIIRTRIDRVFYVKLLSSRMMHLFTFRMYHVLRWCIMYMNLIFVYRIDKYLIQIYWYKQLYNSGVLDACKYLVEGKINKILQ